MAPLVIVSAAAHLVTFALCLMAWAAPRDTMRQRTDRLLWAVGAVLFLALAVSRMTNLEEILRRALRSTILEQGLYAERWEVQAPAAALALAAGGLALLAVWLAWERGKLRNSGKAVIGAAGGMAAMVILLLLRIISLHSIDRLLYGGGVHLNWVLEGAITLLVAACAAWEWRRFKRPPL